MSTEKLIKTILTSSYDSAKESENSENPLQETHSALPTVSKPTSAESKKLIQASKILIEDREINVKPMSAESFKNVVK